MKITILDRLTLTAGDIDFTPLTSLGEVSFHDIIPSERLTETIGDAEILLVNKAVITAQVMDGCKNLKYIGLFATGYNNIDIQAAKERNIAVANVPDYSTDSVAQLAFAFILHFACNLSQYNTSVQNGNWIRSHTFSYFPYPIFELTGKTLGIYGFGSIGKAVAKIGEAFGMEILICSKTIKQNCEYKQVSKEEIFSLSDFLTIHCPLTEQTAGLVNTKTLSLMKPEAFLINTSRGGVIIEPDLADALKNKKIAGAGLDVMTVEPMRADNALLGIENCIITPHVAWASVEARKRLILRAAENITAFLNGSPINIVNN